MTSELKPSPDVPELVRYRVWFDSNYNEIVDEEQDGEYVRHSQASKIIAAERSEKHRSQEAVLKLERELAQYEAQEPVGWLHLHQDFTPEFSNTRLSGGDFYRGFREEPLYASPAPAADLKAENDKLREALRFYADTSKYPAPLTGGMGDLWSDCGEVAKKALKGESNV